MSYGFVYCLGNWAMPGLYKIGHTLNSPHERARQLSSTTSAPDEFYVLGYIEIENPREWESRFHQYLARFRLNGRREFFKCRVVDIAPLFLKNENACAVHDADFSPAAYQEGFEIDKMASPYDRAGNLIQLRLVEVA